MIVGVPKETFPGERRVATIPATVPLLTKAGLHVVLEAGAGEAAGFPDGEYEKRVARIAADRNEVFGCDIVVQVGAFGANLVVGKAEFEHFLLGQVVLGMCDPLGEPQAVREFARTGATVLAREMIPRITRAQSMHVLSA